MATRVLSFLPARGHTLREQFLDCLAGLYRQLRGRGAGVVLRQTVFLRTGDGAPYAPSRRELLRILLRRQGRPAPPTAFIAQAPKPGSGVALEVEILAAGNCGLRVEARRAGGYDYRVLAGDGLRRIYAAGLGGGSTGEKAFRAMAAILKREGLGLGHVVRQWNYIEGILGTRRYQAFNELRGRHYGRARFPCGYPAATGIGADAGGVTVDFIAAAPGEGERRLPLSNPLQTDAYRYSWRVLAPGAGSPPRFERGQILLGRRWGRVFISGTSAIHGQETVRADACGQTRSTLTNILRLASRANLRAHGLPAGWAPAGFTALRVYVKRASDIPAVRRLCRARFPGVPALYLRADICRDGLLVEIEGELALRRVLPRPQRESRPRSLTR